MDAAYPNVADQLFGRAHAIEPNAFRAILEGPLGQRVLAGKRIDSRPPEARRQVHAAVAIANPVSSPNGSLLYMLTDQGIAIISVTGILAKRFDLMAAICGWTTYDSLSASLRAALVDDRVRGILLDVDSPGGVVDGMLDVADEILVARTQLPIWAVADSVAASAAYAIAGSAEQLFLPRLAQVGSIGALTIHVDRSAQDKANGQKFTAIFSGARKIDGWDHGSLTSDAQAAFQARVDRCRDALAALVGRQGRMSASAALRTEAAMYSDSDAVSAGLADGVATFEDVLDALSQKVGMPFGSSPRPTSPQGHKSSAANFRAEGVTMNSRPKVGERCSCCGRIMKEFYTLKMAEEVMELCFDAGVSCEETTAFLKARTPINVVRQKLSQRATTIRSLENAEPLGSDATELWDKTVGEINAALQARLPRGRV